MKARSSTSSSRGGGGGGGGERTNFIVVLLVLGSLGCLKLCCVGLFARGFLFVRVELAQKSSSSSSSHAGESFATDASSSSSSSSSFTTTTTTTTPSLVIDKLILLIIDAARYDWVANSASHSALKREESDDESNKNHGLTELRDYYYNTAAAGAGAGAGAGATARKRKWRKEKSDDIDSDSDTSDSLLFKFIADAPTTTSQRLKGLLTGSLPTFVDVSNSFSSKTLEEDNLIHQLHRNGNKRILFSGDDTWADLFPPPINDDGNNISSSSSFSSSYFTDFEAFPSMNVKDTETVDTGVRNSWKKAHALALKNRNGSNSDNNNSSSTSNDSASFDCNVADWDVWIGHMLGADHVGHTYGAKTKEMRNKLEQNDRDIRNIMNDMKTEKEVYKNALFLVFGDHGMTDEGDHGGSSEVEVNSFLFAHRPHGNIAEVFERDDDDDDDISESEMLQIDLVPTLAVLMDVPIPFSSLGVVNEKLWNLFHYDEKDDADTNNGEQRGSASFAYALDQNVRQVWRYINAYHRVKRFETSAFTRLEEMHGRYQNTSRLESTGSREKKKELGLAFLRETQTMTRSAWVTFGMLSMVFGVIGFFGVLLLYMYCIAYFTSKADVTDAKFETGRRKKVAPTSASSATNSQSFTSFPCLFVASVVVYFLSLAARCSNSFIESEREMYQYLLATLLASTCIDRLRFHKNKHPRDSFVSSNRFAKDGVIYNAILAMICNALLARIGDTWVKTNSTEEISSSRESLLIFATFCFAMSHHLQNFEMAVSWIFWAFSATYRNNLWYPRIVFACSWIWFPVTRQFESLSPRRRLNSIDFLWTLLPVFAVLTNSTHIGGVFVLLSAHMMNFSSKSIGNMLTLFPSTSRPDARHSSLSKSRSDEKEEREKTIFLSRSIFTACVASLLFSQAIFYGGGHWVKFNGLRFTAGMTGMDSFNWYLCGILLGLDTFCGEIISVLMFPIFLSYFSLSSSLSSLSMCDGWKEKQQEGQEEQVEQKQKRVDLNVRSVGFLALAFLRGLGVFVSTFFVAYERRHLMTWAIFAPKFIFEICSLLCFECFLVFSFVLASKTRVYETLSEKQIDEDFKMRERTRRSKVYKSRA